MIERIRSIWENLEAESNHESGYVRLRLDPGITAGLYLALKMPERTRCLLLRLPTLAMSIAVGRLPQYSGLRLRPWSDPNDPTATFLVVALTEEKHQQLFDMLISDIWVSVRHFSRPAGQAAGLVERLGQWKGLFGEFKGAEMSAQSQIGLFGELCWLRSLLQKGMEPGIAVSGWQGSPGGDQDFMFDDVALEVKASAGGAVIHVDNERQLDGASLRDLFLIHYQLKSGHEGDSLPKLVGAVRENIADYAGVTAVLEARLTQCGYKDVHAEQYGSPRYVVDSMTAYRVAAGFPRISASDLNHGVLGVRYSIALDTCDRFKINPEVVEKVLGIEP